MSVDLFSLAGSTVLVVGAGGDLGRRSALVAHRRGARVVVADHPRALTGLEETAAILRAEGGSVDVVSCDVTDEGHVDEAVGVAARNGLDVVVHAAGVMLRRSVFETSLEEFRHVIDVNLTGTWLVNRAAGRVLCAAGRGRIVNFASVYAERVGPVPESAYYAAKAGVGNLTRSLAAEFGVSGVTVNCLALGVFYPTNMTVALRDAPETLEWMTQRTLLHRLGDPERDLDGPLTLLMTRASSYVTGQIVYVDGGWSAW